MSDVREAEALITRNYAGGDRPKQSELTQAAVTSLLHSLDPHSNFFDATEWKDLLDEQRSGYAGTGMSISSFTRAGRSDIYIVSTFDGTPARRAQLKFGDRIVTVNGETMIGRSIDYVRDKVRGPVGSTVKVTIERAATNRAETIEIVRRTVAQPSIPDSYIIRPGVGYIDLSEGFNYTTTEEFNRALNDLLDGGIQSLVLDLRGNGGGLVDQAVKVAEKFLPAGAMIVSQRGRTVADNREWRSSNNLPLTLPLVVLVDENTASASEIVAGALQDHDRALIVGEKTFGKGLVQNVIDLPFKTGLTLTAARYYTPSGRSIQRDYEHVGRYEYFQHNGEAAAIDKPFFASKTVTGRNLVGGDGIAPDEESSSVKLTKTQAALLDPIFFFTREAVNGRISKLVIDRQNADTLIDAFIAFTSQSGFVAIEDESIRKERDFVTLRIRHLMSTAEQGSIHALRVIIDADPQVAAAIRALPRAAQLAERARQFRKNRF